MRQQEKQALESFKRVRDFVTEHPLEAPATYGAPRAMLEDVLARALAHTVDQATHRRVARALTRRTAALKRDLVVGHLRPISQVAKAGLADRPGIELALRTPDRTMAGTRLLAEALAVRNAVAPYAAEFVANAAPPDFLAQLDAAIVALERSVTERAHNVVRRGGARKGLAQEVRRGRAAVQLLDAVVGRQFLNRDEVLERWRAAKRVHDVTGGPRTDAGDGEAVVPIRAA